MHTLIKKPREKKLTFLLWLLQVYYTYKIFFLTEILTLNTKFHKIKKYAKIHFLILIYQFKKC